MKTYTLLFLSCLLIRFFSAKAGENEWIRINQLGYEPAGIKVAVWASKSPGVPIISLFHLPYNVIYTGK